MSNLALLYTRAAHGLDAPLVCVETHISNGLPRLSIVGLAEAEVKESKDRVRSAILNSNFEFPARRITINLAPADLPKEGGRYDLAIALGILIASQQVKAKELMQYEFAGELALSGHLRGFKGALPLAIQTRKAQRHLILPLENAFEAALPQDNVIYAANTLLEVCKHLEQSTCLERYMFTCNNINVASNNLDLQDIYGQAHAKRALEIAAAGRHSMLLIGPPGTGKTMLASRLPGLLPQLQIDEMLEIAAINSISLANINLNNAFKRPFRAPHHTISPIALIGGGAIPRPGEISLAHNGVLFLDELPEFDRKTLETLREPLECGYIAIARAHRKVIFPAQFQLIAAMNPCPCGNLSNPHKTCICSHDQITRYQNKISNPLLERIDLHVEVPAVPANYLTNVAQQHSENTLLVRKRVQLVQEIQKQRNNKFNSLLNNNEVKTFCSLDAACANLMHQAVTKLNLSARNFYRTLKIARTIADLAGCQQIAPEHITEALGFRSKLNLQS